MLAAVPVPPGCCCLVTVYRRLLGAPILVCCLTFADGRGDGPVRPASGEGGDHRTDVVSGDTLSGAPGRSPPAGTCQVCKCGLSQVTSRCTRIIGFCERTVMSDRSLRCVVACRRFFSNEEMPSLAAVTTLIRGGRPSRGRSPSAGLLSVMQLVSD